MRKTYDVGNITVTPGTANINVVRADTVTGPLRADLFIAPDHHVHLDTLNVEEISPSSGHMMIKGGNLCVSGKLNINTLDSCNGMYVCMPCGMNADTIISKTGNGVTVDGALFNQGKMYANGTNTVELVSNKNVPFGYLGLNEAGKIEVSSLSSGSLVFAGYFDATTGQPNLTDASLKINGNFYVVSVSGTTSIGNGPQSLTAGDYIVYVSDRWILFPSSTRVTSVNGKTGSIVLTTDDIPQSGDARLYYKESLVCSNEKVKAAANHRAIVSGNPHQNTPADVGNNIAQWNANKLRGKSVQISTLEDGATLKYSTAGAWVLCPTSCGGNGGSATLVLSASKSAGTEVNFSTGGLFNFPDWDVTLNNLSFNSSNGTWVFPSSGTYRIMWGASYNYIFGATVNADARIVITGVSDTALIAPVCLTFSDRKTCSGTWVGTVPAGASAAMMCCQSTGGPTGNFVDSYWIVIEKW